MSDNKEKPVKEKGKKKEFICKICSCYSNISNSYRNNICSTTITSKSIRRDV